MAILRWGGGRNKEGKSHKSVKEVSFEINLEGQEGAYFLVGQRHIISEAVGAPVVSLVARHSCGSEDVAKEGIQGEAAKVDWGQISEGLEGHVEDFAHDSTCHGRL